MKKSCGLKTLSPKEVGKNIVIVCAHSLGEASHASCMATLPMSYLFAMLFSYRFDFATDTIILSGTQVR